MPEGHVHSYRTSDSVYEATQIRSSIPFLVAEPNHSDEILVAERHDHFSRVYPLVNYGVVGHPPRNPIPGNEQSEKSYPLLFHIGCQLPN